MIIPTFKVVATILIGIFIGSVIIIIRNFMNRQINLPFPDLLFIISACLIGLLFLGIIYGLWEREIKIFYEAKKNKKK